MKDLKRKLIVRSQPSTADVINWPLRDETSDDERVPIVEFSPDFVEQDKEGNKGEQAIDREVLEMQSQLESMTNTRSWTEVLKGVKVLTIYQRQSHSHDSNPSKRPNETRRYRYFHWSDTDAIGEIKEIL